ncbi:MAG: spore cortex-lytic protein [Syntrophomonadaceae bacterium]|jgi:N-acetylmuramoyl-L-alanine amidase|nr:spore cortex-lytic protein [Syntrophomonadaceae bacterium]
MKTKEFKIKLSIGILIVCFLGVSLLFNEFKEEEPILPVQGQIGEPRADDVWMISRMVAAESRGEPFTGQVAVASVIVNRVRDPKFPGTVNGVIYQPWAFSPIMDGAFWSVAPTENHLKAARYALNGWDPSYGSTFFWNPATATSKWVWSRRIITRIGKHVFGI